MKITIDLGCNAQPRKFSSKKAAKIWIMDGLMSTDGAEQSHYVSMLLQLEAGETLIDYWKEI